MSATKTYLQQVAEFHSAFKVRQPNAPDLSDKPTNILRPKLITEELHEFAQAWRDNNRIEQLDALCDTQYVLSGAILSWGYRRLFESQRIVIELGAIRDMDGHIAAMMGLNDTMSMAAVCGFENQVYTMLELLQRRLTKLVYALKFQDVFSEAFTEVHRSNLSKLWSDVDLETSDKQFQEERWSAEATIGGFIMRREDGKIIKSPSYSPADLVRFVK